jgi:hypothetical protein
LGPGFDNGAMGKWTVKEGAKLIGAVKQHRNNWIAAATLVPGRTNVACRSRWANSLDPGIDHRVMGNGKRKTMQSELRVCRNTAKIGSQLP